MKLTIAVAGAGRQGLCAAHDIAGWGSVERVVLVDRDADRLAHARDRLIDLGAKAEIVATVADASSVADMKRALAGAQAVLSAVPYRYGPVVCAAAAELGAHSADLGGNLDVSASIHQLAAIARGTHCIVAPDCGLMPGLGNTLGGWAVSELESRGCRDIDVTIRCGGLPRKPANALQYELVFSFDGLMNEYDGASLVIRDGALASEPTLEDISEWMHPKLGRLETATTSGGTSTAPRTLLSRARNYHYKTVRYAGHFQFFRILKNLGLFIPPSREKLRALLEPALYVEHPDDLVLLRVDATAGTGESVSREYLEHRDERTGFTAMERMTAIPAVIVLELALEGALEPGAVFVESGLPCEETFARLARRGIVARPHG
jgi:lysine 6-dehydrogenase